MARQNAFREMFSFEGRIRRLDWWLISIGVGVLSGLVSPIAQIALGEATVPGTLGISPLTAISITMQIAFTWPLLAAAVKRSHDRGQSGTLPVINLMLVWLPIVLAIVAPGLFKTPPLMWMLTGLFVINALISVWLLITLGFLDGTPGANQYGPSPKGSARGDYQAPRND
ncbi:MAG: DUF805 domain-containing protein [Caulobacterales bacterium]|nr:DUF805 domain-containing protein [Caulobacterales bacterium]